MSTTAHSDRATRAPSPLPRRLPDAPGLLRSALLWGAALTAGFYTLIDAGAIDSQLLVRYFCGHPIEYATAALFFWAIAALAIKLLGVLGQRRLLNRTFFPPDERFDAADAPALLARLRRLPPGVQRSRLVYRLAAGLEYVESRGTSDGLEEHLTYEAQQEADRAHASYALVRVLTWAVPILGFLGTVVGITMAIANVSPQQLESSLPQVTGGLAVAFDTTALALALSIGMMFASFAVERAENALLAAVHDYAIHRLARRFLAETQAAGDAAASIEHALHAASQTILQTGERLIQRQTAAWSASFDEMRRRWSEAAERHHKLLEQTLATALAEHARRLQQQVEAWGADAAGIQHALTEQSRLLLRLTEGHELLARLQQGLDENLRALAGSHAFEQTLHSLTAAIHLLTARPRSESSRAA